MLLAAKVDSVDVMIPGSLVDPYVGCEHRYYFAGGMRYKLVSIASHPILIRLRPSALGQKRLGVIRPASTECDVTHERKNTTRRMRFAA